MRGIDRTGQKYNNLTFIRICESVKISNKTRRVWEVACDCGKTIYTTKSPAIVNGDMKSCGCMKDLAQRRYSPIISSARKVWRHHHYNDGDIDFDTFYKLSQLPCHYCDRLPHRTSNLASGRKDYRELQKEKGDFIYNGLDRIDSNKKHMKDNVVPCCTMCNYMKFDHTMEEFIAHIERIYAGTREHKEISYIEQLKKYDLEYPDIPAKITEEIVLVIRRDYATGNYSISELSQKYIISKTTVRNICLRKTWKNVA